MLRADSGRVGVGAAPFGVGFAVITAAAVGLGLVAVIAFPRSPAPVVLGCGVLGATLLMLVPTGPALRYAPPMLALGPALAALLSQQAGAAASAVPLAVIGAFLVIALRQRDELVLGLPEAAMAALVSAFVIGLLHGDGPGQQSLVIRTLAPFFLAWALARVIARRSGDEGLLWGAAAAFIVINAPVGLFEAATGMDIGAYRDSALVAIADTGVARPNGLMSTDIDFAMSLTFAAAVLLGSRLSASRFRDVAVPLALLGSAAVVVAYFRTAWMILIVLWACWLYRQTLARRVLAAVAIVAALPLVVELARRASDSAIVQARVSDPSNVLSRMAALEQAWTLFVGSPVFGVGLNAFRVQTEVVTGQFSAVVTPHNVWLGALAELGIVGGLALVAVVATHAADAWRSRRSPQAPRGSVWALVVALAFSFTFYTLTVPVAMILIGLALGTLRGCRLHRVLPPARPA